MGENLEVIREDLWDDAKGSEKVKVIITGEHTRPGNSGEKESHTETTRNEVSGILRRAKGGVILLEYEEALEEGVDIVTFNRVKIKPSSLEISRKGSVDTELVWKEGEDQDTEYKTPYGQMKMHTHTERYQTNHSGSGISRTHERDGNVKGAHSSGYPLPGCALKETLPEFPLSSYFTGLAPAFS